MTSNIYGMFPTEFLLDIVQFYDIRAPNQHHIEMIKSLTDVDDIILLLRLHNQLTWLEPTKDIQYKYLWEYFNDCFKRGEAPTLFWNERLQEIYESRLEVVINQWETSYNRYQADLKQRDEDLKKVLLNPNQKIHEIRYPEIRLLMIKASDIKTINLIQKIISNYANHGVLTIKTYDPRTDTWV